MSTLPPDPVHEDAVLREPAPPRIGSPWRARALVKAILQAGLGIALVVLVLRGLGPTWAELTHGLTMDGVGLGWGGLGALVGTLVTTLRWRMVSEALGGRALPFRVYLHAFTWSRLLAQFLPALLVDVVGRSATLRASGSVDTWRRLGGVIVLERLLDVLLPMCLLAVAVLTHERERGSKVLALGLAVLAFAVLTPWLLRSFTALGVLLFARVRGRSLAVPPASLRLSLAVVALGLVRYAALCVQFWGFGAGVGVVLDPLVLVPSSAVAQLASVIAITPGGLGFQEGGWAAGLVWQGIDAAATTRFVLAARFGMLLSFSFLAAVAWAWTRAGARPLTATADRRGDTAP